MARKKTRNQKKKSRERKQVVAKAAVEKSSGDPRVGYSLDESMLASLSKRSGARAAVFPAAVQAHRGDDSLILRDLKKSLLLSGLVFVILGGLFVVIG